MLIYSNIRENDSIISFLSSCNTNCDIFNLRNTEVVFSTPLFLIRPYEPQCISRSAFVIHLSGSFFGTDLENVQDGCEVPNWVCIVRVGDGAMHDYLLNIRRWFLTRSQHKKRSQHVKRKDLCTDSELLASNSTHLRRQYP